MMLPAPPTSRVLVPLWASHRPTAHDGSQAKSPGSPTLHRHRAYRVPTTQERGPITTRSQLWPAARIAFIGALVLFVTTIVTGILNGIDVYTPDHDTLMGHVHAGTLGWITLALTGAALLVFTDSRAVPPAETARARWLTTAMTGAVLLFVAAFYAGDGIPGSRLGRPITGAILLVVIIWFLAWMIRFQMDVARTVARLGLLLAFTALVIGALFGIALGVALSGRHVPGLTRATANAISEAHPASMMIGFQLLAAFSMIEWLLGDRPIGESFGGVFQMWMLFIAGIVVDVVFVLRVDDVLLAPANAAMLAGVVMLIVRRRSDLRPSTWRGAGTGLFPRIGMVFLIGYLALLTIIVIRYVGGAMDIAALSVKDKGLLAGFDHAMFIGVMTNAVFGALALTLHGKATTIVDRVLLWGVTVGTAGFIFGLILAEPLSKRVFTPIMGGALLFGVVAYLREMRRTAANSG